MKTSNAFAAACCAFALSACGGGGGGGGGGASSPAPAQTSTLSTITAANAPRAASNGYSGSALISQSSSSLTDIVTGVSVTPASIGVVTPALDLVKHAYNRQGGDLLAGVVVSEPCAGGGTISIDANLRNQSALSNGDTMSITAKNCSEGSGFINGTMTISVSGVSGDIINGTSGAATLDARFIGFGITSGNTVDSVDGDMKVALGAASTSNLSLSISGSSLKALETSGSTTLTSMTLTNYAMNGSLRGTTMSFAADFTIAGSSSALGQFSYTVKNLAPFVGTTSGVPASGSLIVNGNASSVTATVVDNKVRLDYSAKGDGVITQTSTLSWGDFLATF